MSNKNQEVFFRNCYYNSRSNNIHLWWHINGKDRYDKIDYEHDYYAPALEHDLVNPNATIKTDLFGNKMVRKVVDRPKDVVGDKTKLAESDLRPEVKFLHTYFNGIELKADIKKVQIMYYDIEVAIGARPFREDHPIKVRQIGGKPMKTTIDEFETNANIENYEAYDEQKKEWIIYKKSCYVPTDEFPNPEDAKYPVNAIAQYFSRDNKLYVYGDKPFNYIDKEGNKGSMSALRARLKEETTVDIGEIEFIVCDEKVMLEKFMDTMHKHKTDIFTGWNTEGFDNLYVINRLKHLGSKKDFSPIKQTYVRKGKNGKTTASIGGISSIDYMRMYKEKYTFDNKIYYSLNNISKIELGKTKLDYEGSIKDFYINEWDDFMLYNMIDTMLVKGLDDKMGFMNLAMITANNNRLLAPDVLSTIAGHTGNVIELLHKQGMVLNNRDTSKHNDEGYPGGISWNNPGFYKYCVSFDIASMYPHLVVRDNLGPETVEMFPDESQLKDVVRIDDHERKRSFFFWKEHKLQVGRDVDGELKVIEVNAKDVLDTDMVILYPDNDGWQGAPKWNFNMGNEVSWFPRDK